MGILELMKERRIYFDGGMGSLLQARGLKPGELPETWNLSRPEIITEIHREYLNAGSDVVTTNTFGANHFKFKAEDGYSVKENRDGGGSKCKKTPSRRPDMVTRLWTWDRRENS